MVDGIIFGATRVIHLYPRPANRNQSTHDPLVAIDSRARSQLAATETALDNLKPFVNAKQKEWNALLSEYNDLKRQGAMTLEDSVRLIEKLAKAQLTLTSMK